MANKTNNSALIGIIAVVILSLAVAGTIVLKKKSSPSSSSTVTSQADTNAQPSMASMSDMMSTNFKDGTYTANGTYSSPGGDESIDVTVTIASNKITSSSVAPQASSRESMEYQDDFQSGYAKLVNGKDIATLKLSKVSGSSLTSRGFNEAIDKIKSQAKT